MESGGSGILLEAALVGGSGGAAAVSSGQELELDISGEFGYRRGLEITAEGGWWASLGSMLASEMLKTEAATGPQRPWLQLIQPNVGRQCGDFPRMPKRSPGWSPRARWWRPTGAGETAAGPPSAVTGHERA